MLVCTLLICSRLQRRLIAPHNRCLTSSRNTRAPTDLPTSHTATSSSSSTGSCSSPCVLSRSSSQGWLAVAATQHASLELTTATGAGLQQLAPLHTVQLQQSCDSSSPHPQQRLACNLPPASYCIHAWLDSTVQQHLGLGSSYGITPHHQLLAPAAAAVDAWEQPSTPTGSSTGSSSSSWFIKASSSARSTSPPPTPTVAAAAAAAAAAPGINNWPWPMPANSTADAGSWRQANSSSSSSSNSNNSSAGGSHSGFVLAHQGGETATAAAAAATLAEAPSDDFVHDLEAPVGGDLQPADPAALVRSCCSSQSSSSSQSSMSSMSSGEVVDDAVYLTISAASRGTAAAAAAAAPLQPDAAGLGSGGSNSCSSLYSMSGSSNAGSATRMLEQGGRELQGMALPAADSSEGAAGPDSEWLSTGHEQQDAGAASCPPAAAAACSGGDGSYDAGAGVLASRADSADSADSGSDWSMLSG